MQILRLLSVLLLALTVLGAGSALLARLAEHQKTRTEAEALNRPEARVALAKAWPTK